MSAETYHILTLIGVVICIVLLLVLVLIPYRRRP
jgi:uncharacterized membrane protein YkgB